jgi:hypothetical protein
MPFISSVSGSRGGWLFRLLNVSLPSVAIDAVTNFNENRATFNATVNPNGGITSVQFQYSTDGSTWTNATLNTGLIGASQSVSTTQLSLSVGTLYYVRAVATNLAGSSTSSNTTFTTWSLKTFTQTTAGAYSISIPSITGVAPTVYEMLLYGGGGGANYGGGGGGGYRLFSSHTSSSTGTQTISGTVGSGGAAGNGGGGVGTATTGGSTTLTIGSSSWTGGGGTAGEHPGANSAPSGRGGTAGSGTNVSNLGGTNAYGYYYFTGNYVQVVVGYNTGISGYDKNGNPQYYTDYNSPIYGPDYNQPIYAWSASYYACGGGGGTNSVGGNATGHTTATQIGGNGGTGGGAYGLRGGNGGGGYGTQGNGSAGGFSVGSGTIVGSGGSQFGAGLAGGITFKYYGP